MALPLALTIVYLPARELTESSSFGLSKQVAWSEAFLNRQVTTEDDNQDEGDAEQIAGRERRERERRTRPLPQAVLTLGAAEDALIRVAASNFTVRCFATSESVNKPSCTRVFREGLV